MGPSTCAPLPVPEVVTSYHDPRSALEAPKDVFKEAHKEALRGESEHVEMIPTKSYQGSMLSFFLGEEQARQATMYEQRMTLSYALRHYKTAVI